MTEEVLEVRFLAGLEVHITVKSQKKIFNWEDVFRGDDVPPNSRVGPWELGYPGFLPIVNPEVIELALKLALALKMKVEKFLFFERKLYNYPDLPKGFQITQKNYPFASKGVLRVLTKEGREVKVAISHLQLEEDTAKMIRTPKEIKLDFNRAGNPLIELVTKPVFSDLGTITSFLEQLQGLLVFFDLSEAKMEKGQLRVDLNYSLKINNSYSTPRYEIKNLNSLANLKLALEKEVAKHENNYREGTKPPPSSTIGFSGDSKEISVNRQKKEYWYVPETNIPPLKISGKNIAVLGKKVAKGPWEQWKKLTFLKVKLADELLLKPRILRILLFFEEKRKIKLEYANSLVNFCFNFLLNKDDEEERKIKKNWQNIFRLFLSWRNKQKDGGEVKEALKTILEGEGEKTELVEKESLGKSLIEELERELEASWSPRLEVSLKKDPQKAADYLLGVFRRKYANYSAKQLIFLVNTFLQKKAKEKGQ